MGVTLNLVGSPGGTALNLSTPIGDKITIKAESAFLFLSAAAAEIETGHWTKIAYEAKLELIHPTPIHAGQTYVVTDVQGEEALLKLSFTPAVINTDTPVLGLELIFPGFYTDGTNLYFELSSLPGVSSIEADVSTGNWVDIFQGMLLAFDNWMKGYNVYTQLTTCDIFLLQNPNTSKKILSLLPLWKNTFLCSFNVTYASSKLKAEN